MQRALISRLIIQVHRVHRWVGTAMALLMAIWFASGAMMTFVSYPAYTDAERLAHAPPLTAALGSAAAPEPTVGEGGVNGVRLTAASAAARPSAVGERGMNEVPLTAASAAVLPLAVGEGGVNEMPLTAAVASAGAREPAVGEGRVTRAPLKAASVGGSGEAGMGADGLVPPQLFQWLREGGLANGGQARLMMLEGEPRWLLQSDEQYQALRAQAPLQTRVAALDSRRARAAAEATHGPCGGEASILDEPDQWTVGRSHPRSYPLQRIACDDAGGLELYVSTRTGEIVQESTRSERVLAWLGPIPHWIYPAVLRRERELWRDLVLWLSAIGCLVTLSGMLAGTHAWLRRAHNHSSGSARESRKRRVQQQVYLRWHQRLGLGFGLFASTWIFSGALSLEPFHWTNAASAGDQARAWSQVVVSPQLPLQLQAALAHCRVQLPELRELELVALGKLYAVCSDARAQTRIVDLEDPQVTPLRRIPDEQLQQLARTLSAATQLTLAEEADDYYYPTHRQPIARPYARYALHDASNTVVYVDPSRGQLLQQMDDRKRLERWLYHGLHSWDVPALYAYRSVWRAVIIAAMAIGTTLATLGALIFVRRRRLSAQRARPAAHPHASR